jgi:hypothetical protein
MPTWFVMISSFPSDKVVLQSTTLGARFAALMFILTKERIHTRTRIPG